MRTFKASHLNFAFIAAVGLLILALGGYMWLEMRGVEAAVRSHEGEAAREELGEALTHLDERIRATARTLEQWDETRQQFAYAEYYPLWRDDRVRSAGIVPADMDTVALYDKGGHILSPGAPKEAMPERLGGRSSHYRIDKADGYEHVYFFFPIHADPDGHVLLGHGGIKMDLLDALKEVRGFRFIDAGSLTPGSMPERVTKLAELREAFHYQLRPNPYLDLFKEVFQHTLTRLALLIMVILALESFFIHRLLVKPLRAISEEIDALQHASESLLVSERQDKPLPIHELENVRRSFSDYQSRLAEMHQNLERSSRDFYDQARRDALTGAYNRRAFEEDWRGLDGGEGAQRGALILFDCDHFKAINDTYGHDVGDTVIRLIAQSLQSNLRAQDRLYRLGGDEFATFLVDADRQQAGAIAERCLEQAQALDTQSSGMSEPISLSIGVASCAGRSPNLSQMMKCADLAMYEAKRPGNRKIVFYEEGMGEMAPLVANRSINAVYQAIQDPGLLEMRYQPIIRLPWEDSEYAESLARIRYEGVLISPADIFPIVQGRRLDVEFDLAIIQAIQQDMSSGRIPPGQGVSINLSAPALVHAKAIHALLDLREREPARKLVVEITETALITQMGTATEHIRSLRQAGFLIALDDFGSGYSSLRYLAAMPVDLVKFDISMVRLLTSDDRKQRLITEEIARMALTAGYQLVAEGVETREVLDQVIRLGFTHAQGFYFGRV